ncbi:Chorismate mutase [Rhynchospora pubera]|uniref:Chorismate mutase n=1 Tax=Rhynchospora pubera TaxID=906938 RepID=A0AAV8G7U9_9POAL|nr:Chorismate mutase [Rhynchospora pubera]
MKKLSKSFLAAAMLETKLKAFLPLLIQHLFLYHYLSSLLPISMACNNKFTLDSVRDALIREEDSIVFSLIERARFPYNAPAYDPSFLGNGFSIAEFYVRGTESLQAKIGRYQKPEDVPFFPKDLPSPLPPTKDSQKVLLHPASASVTVNEAIWKFYFTELLPLFTTKGNDGNYASTVASDFVCLQAISRRIHSGKYVAEVKFTDAPQDYSPAISSKDRDKLMDLLTFVAVEEAVKKRVEKKARLFSQNVTLDENDSGKTQYKINPLVVSHLYDKWVMPLTKVVEVEYLLLRLS